MFPAFLLGGVGGFDVHMQKKHYFKLNFQAYLSGPKLTDSLLTYNL